MKKLLEELNRQVGWRLWLGEVFRQFGASKWVLRRVLGLTPYQIHIIVERAKVTQKFRLEIFHRDNYICYLCKHFKCWLKGMPMIVEHKWPVSRGGFTTKQNCGTACWHCNEEKGTMTEAEYLASKGR